MKNEIKIPWYRKNVKKIGHLSDPAIPNFDFPDRKKKPNPRPRKPDPRPILQTRPEPAFDPVKEVDPYAISDPVQTPIPVGLPVSEKNRLPSLNPLPNARWGDKPTTKSPIPTGNGLAPAIRMPSGEILFKLMEAEPSGKYNQFIQDYNDVSLELMWNIANPFIIFSEPSYTEIKVFLDTHDFDKMTSDDVIKYFKDEGVSGKDLLSLPVRLFTFKKAIDTMSTIEDIIVPPLPQNKNNKIY